MTIPDIEFTSSVLYKFLIAGILLFAFFRISFYVLRLFVKNKKFVKAINRYFPLLEMLVWILFAIKALGEFIESNQILAIGVALFLLFILFWIFRFSLKDIIAGVFFKSSGQFSKNDILNTDEFSGRIKKLGLHSLELETESRKTIFIPYSKIIENINVRLDTPEMKSAYTFRVDIPKAVNENAMADEIKNYLVSLPWISVKVMPRVKIISRTSTHIAFEISIHTINSSYILKTEKYLEEKFLSNDQIKKRADKKSQGNS